MIEFSLEAIGERLRTQDNRITAHPIFEVQERKRKKWKYVQPFFTEVAAQRYIEQNGHNHTGDLRIFAGSAFRNWEWQAMREFLSSQGSGPAPAAGKEEVSVSVK